jgi:hypothetical protein
MIEDFFDHTCDIYHPVVKIRPRGYGLPDAEDGTLTYSEEADISDQPCHFSVKQGSLTTWQLEPQKELEGRIKLTLPVDADVRLNDKIVSKESGYSYEAEAPRNIRGHHKTVWIKRVYPRGL